jgi:tRNA-specific 2-thiouridylase
MSGGVDSSVAAARLVQEGYRVVGMMLRLWSEPGLEAANRCCTPEAMSLARRVAAQLEIPFYAVDVRQAFHAQIVQPFIDGYTQGLTPNPCLSCNRQVRFGLLLQQAQALGAAYLATGHYARLRRMEQGQVQLLTGLDGEKDQSYALSMLRQAQLSQALFPIGELAKPQVRHLAREFNLPVAERADSQDLCFLAGEDYREFLLRHAPQAAAPGPIEDLGGRRLGQHQGLAFYTIGQRKGLGLAASHPFYVLAKDLASNTLIVGPAEQLGWRELVAAQVNWISGAAPPGPLPVQVKIRYKARLADAVLAPLEGGRVHMRFSAPLRDVTPGQAAVFYDGEVCLGGAIIEQALRGGAP